MGGSIPPLRGARRGPRIWPPMADGGYLGAGGRLAGGPADELVRPPYAHELRAAPRLAYDLSLSDIAHAVALTESGALPAATAAALLRGLLELHAIPVAEFPWQAASATPSTRARPSWCVASAATPRAG